MGMKKTLFFTGFPGFLATGLMRQIIQDQYANIDHIYLLVLQQEKNKALHEITTFQKAEHIPKSMFTILEGDITKKNLRIDPVFQEQIQKKVTHVFHLAAIYDLAVPKNIARIVNVHGTSNVNDWVQSLENLERYIYFSTAYVSGKREGKIYETDLSNAFGFRNHYEETKYEAEVLVQQMKDKLPTTIIRPGIVKGHSTTGETMKFDGLYFFLNFYDRLRYAPFIPYISDGKGAPEGNFVSSDYVLKATSFLAFHSIGIGKTYHLTDPKPYNTLQLQEMVCEAYLGRKPQGVISVDLVKAILSLRAIRKFLQVEKEALDYFTIYSSYDTSQTLQDLENANITAMDLKKTLPSMIKFYRKYKDDYTKHIEIL